MVYSVNTAFVNQFSDSIKLLSHQNYSVFENLVTVGDCQGEYKFFDYIGDITFTARTASNEATSFYDVTHTKRAVRFDDYSVTMAIDKQVDLQRMAADLQSPYVTRAVGAWKQKIDDVIVAAMFGTATTGKGVGASFGSQAFDTANQTVATTFQAGDPIGASNGTGSASGFTFAKFLKGRETLLANNAVPAGSRIMLALGPQQESELLTLNEFKNRDYVAEQQLIASKMVDVYGLIGVFYGVEIYRANTLVITDPASASNQYRSCPMWVKDGVGLVKGGSPEVQMMPNPEKQFTLALHISGSAGSVRLEEKKIVEIRCREGADAS